MEACLGGNVRDTDKSPKAESQRWGKDTPTRPVSRLPHTEELTQGGESPGPVGSDLQVHPLALHREHHLDHFQDEGEAALPVVHILLEGLHESRGLHG